MDSLLYLLHVQEQDELDEEFRLHVLCIAALCVGVLENQNRKIRRRNPSRLYLCRPQLMPSPRYNSPWIRLYRSQDDRAFITTMGFDVATFHLLLNGPGHFAELWDSTPIPRDDVSSGGEPRIGARSLDATGGLGLVLHYLASAVLEVGLQQVFAVVPSVLSRYLEFGMDILLRVLRQMPEARIQLPRTLEDFERNSNIIASRHSLLEGAFGSIDGLSLPLQVSDDVELENATYNGWKTDHRINNILVFSPDGA
ncbi:hypothetical protein V5O48_015256 [Marasmius crinis-equi]|uniref:Uncharacterized protein n=1 Tax=Marasmius crinis-equi TaxID=585013 RepID=A0ABR3EV08_9AGAR